MDNVGGRASWDAVPYNTTLRQPNLNQHDSPSTSSQLSIDAPEFVPRFKALNINSGGQIHPQAVQVMPHNIDPSIIIQHGGGGPTYQQQQPMMAGHRDHHHMNQLPPHQQQLPPHMHHSQSQHVHSNIHEQNTMAAVNRNDHHHHNKFSVQNRLSMGGGGGPPPSGNHMMNGNGGGDMYGGGQQQQAQQNDGAQNVTEKENRVLNFLSDIMNKLPENPGMYEEIQNQISNMFYDFTGNNFVVSNAVEMTFELSVDEQNFRYIGARLCRLLDSLNSRNTLFRQLLCLKIDDHQAKLPGFLVANEQRKVRGTTLFLAELYMQMQNDGTRIMKIAESIVCSIQLLLQKGGPENVKCVCQALKLCGYELDLDYPMKIKNIMKLLIDMENDLDVSTGRLLKSVIDLKAQHWGRSEPVMMTPIMEAIRQDYNDVPVFYGPDGQVLTDEENTFLLSNIPSYTNINFDDLEDNDPDELVEAEPEMDLEIQLAFKDFVKNNKNKQ